MNCRNYSRQNICRFSVYLIAITFISLNTPSIAKAQLKPWDYTNQVFVDLSVINDNSDLRKINPYARFTPLNYRNLNQLEAHNVPNFENPLLAPPKQRPVSSFLLKKRPNIASVGTSKPNIKLISPKDFKRRSSISKARKLIRKQKLAKVRTRKSENKTTALKTSQVKPGAERKLKHNTQTQKKLMVKSGNVKTGEVPPAPIITPAPSAPSKDITLASNKKKASAEQTQPNISKSQETEQAALPRVVTDTKSINVTFAPGSSDLNSGAKKTLNSIATRLRKNENIRMQLMAYAGESNMSASKARRLSLSRALAIRSYLIEKGVRGTRIDVRALGNKVSSGLPNRVDLRVVSQ